MRNDLETLKTLGRTTPAPKDYDPSVLDAFANKHPERDYWVTFTAPEFTTLCPKTGQPDFATLTIRYIPAKKLVESKSLKLYLFGFRNHGDFHEDVINVIYDDLVKLLKPKYLEVYGKFAARGGISIDPFVNGGAGAKYKALANRRFVSWQGVRGVLAAVLLACAPAVQAKTQEIAVWRGETVAVPLHDAIESPELPSAQAPLRVRLGSAQEIKYLAGRNGRRFESCLDKVVWDGGAGPHRWVEVSAADDAAPGVSRFGDLSVRVIDATLPKPSAWHYYLDLWQHPWAVARYFRVKPFSSEHYAKMKPLWETLASAGQKTITVSLLEQPWDHQCRDAYHPMVRRVRRADGSWSFDYALFDEYVRFAEGCGLGPDISCYTMCPWGYLVSWEDEKGELHRRSAKPGEPFFEEYWKPFLKDFREHVKAKGWLGRTFIAMDERTPEDVRIICDLVAREAPGIKTSMAGNQNPANFAGITIDSYSSALGLDYITPEFLAEAKRRRAAGLVTTFYICCWPDRPNTFLSSETDEAFWCGAYSAFAELDGMLRWAWNSWPTDPDRDASFGHWKAGDTFLVYPDNSPSIRFLTLRRGIIAAEKVRILKEKGMLDEKQYARCLKLFDLKRAFEDKTVLWELVADVEKLVNPQGEVK